MSIYLGGGFEAGSLCQTVDRFKREIPHRCIYKRTPRSCGRSPSEEYYLKKRDDEHTAVTLLYKSQSRRNSNLERLLHTYNSDKIFNMLEEGRVTKREFNWLTVLWYIHLHALALYGVVILLTQAKWLTLFFTLFIIFLSNMGMRLGAHRLWAHATYEARGHVRFLLMLAQTLTGVGPIYDWVLAHRIHHKYYRTEKDPYNHGKGFIYSHLFGNLMTAHPDEESIVQSIDMRDVDMDGWVWFQRRFYWPLFIIVGLLLPINAPAEYWGESLLNAVFALGFLRLAVTVNLAWLINSGMLIWGLKPGDKFPANDNSVFVITKSYWPNYHYLISWDYKSGEYGTYNTGCTSLVINILSQLGSISLLKSASSESIRDALYRVATSKNVTIDEALEDIRDIAEKEAATVKLSYMH